ncbi:MAG: hypothetical protein LCH31_10840 [Actinobacteria bacterium]|nr:hypothetical protein [Actinomycetota bacterium]
MHFKPLSALVVAALVAVSMTSCAEAANVASVVLPEMVTPVPRTSADPCAELSEIIDRLPATNEPAWERPDDLSMAALDMADATGNLDEFASFREAAEDVAFYAVDPTDPYFTEDEVTAYYDAVDNFIFELDGVFEICGWDW